MDNDETISTIINGVSPDLSRKMREWFINNPVEIWWDYNDEVSKDGIDMLLSGNHHEFVEDIWEGLIATDWLYQEETENVKECVREFLFDMLGGIVIDSDDIDENDIDEIADGLDLQYEIIVNYNIDKLINMTFTRLTLDLELEHLYMPHNSYDECDYVLDFFNINPLVMQMLIDNSVDKWMLDGDAEVWPDMPERNGHELVDPKRLLDSWYNMPYSGCYVAMLGGYLDLLDISNAIESGKENGNDIWITLVPGTLLITHSYWNGSGGLEFELKKELRIKIVKDGQLCRDGAFSYGVDDVHGMTSEAWESDFGIEIVVNEKEMEVA